MRGAAVAFMFAFGVVLSAQDATAPTLNAEQLARIDAYEAKIESAQLKIALLQGQLEKLAREAQDYLQAQQRDGYTLTKTEKGWIYQPTAK